MFHLSFGYPWFESSEENFVQWSDGDIQLMQRGPLCVIPLAYDRARREHNHRDMRDSGGGTRTDPRPEFHSEFVSYLFIASRTQAIKPNTLTAITQPRAHKTATLLRNRQHYVFLMPLAHSGSWHLPPLNCGLTPSRCCRKLLLDNVVILPCGWWGWKLRPLHQDLRHSRIPLFDKPAVKDQLWCSSMSRKIC